MIKMMMKKNTPGAYINHMLVSDGAKRRALGTSANYTLCALQCTHYIIPIDSHETKSCRHNENSAFRCCANCSKAGEDDPYHSARSSICPYFLKTKKEILQRLLI